MPDDIQPKSSPAKPKAVANSGEATERAVININQKQATQYVVTVDNATSYATKIEKLDAETGARTEFTLQQYEQAACFFFEVAPYLGSAAPQSGAYAFSTTASVNPQTTMGDAYYRAIAEYLRAMSGLS